MAHITQDKTRARVEICEYVETRLVKAFLVEVLSRIQIEHHSIHVYVENILCFSTVSTVVLIRTALVCEVMQEFYHQR